MRLRVEHSLVAPALLDSASPRPRASPSAPLDRINRIARSEYSVDSRVRLSEDGQSGGGTGGWGREGRGRTEHSSTL